MDIRQYSTCTAKRVIAVGRLTPVKGYERLLNIWGNVNAKHPDWHLDIFGDGSLKNELTNYANSNHINNVTLRGITHHISQEYANSSICTVTSYYEGFSLVILEAMMHGVPCVAFDCPNGPRSIIKDQQCGYLIENGNDNLFTEKLCHLIEDQELRTQFSKAAIERSKIFNIDTIMGQWKSLFESLCQQTIF
jgi:glycosyltransferase involved in cell wall biosynthesis